MTPNRSTPTRCVIPACPYVGYFAAFAGRCPEHRADPPRQPTLAEAWESDDER